jgi:hypothetical protein
MSYKTSFISHSSLTKLIDNQKINWRINFLIISIYLLFEKAGKSKE